MSDTCVPSRQAEMVLVDGSSTEWEPMWAALERHPLNAGLDNPRAAMSEDGQSWQYLGSWKTDRGIVHEFRHRQHPALSDRACIKIQASPGFVPRS